VITSHTLKTKKVVYAYKFSYGEEEEPKKSILQFHLVRSFTFMCVYVEGHIDTKHVSLCRLQF